ncbi:MAG TPA: acetyl-CoA carboxylase biotin carboxyl carrier protein subunit [Quisquiliibacterium sp.]|nr:acetyl-CoA carboxylase biotin carboxyl carrier protein subunit [Quisquiliibacterium sp.]HPA91898.1 acetyl-CoA carboxylase biotin carboxyl carrier protein subunit [Quisquiliibacterium sp.]HQD82041.1 acetyl-CoA carboxylase biotin carboxyl carrier protein subunit [Quisquiliibacterium sp.]HQN13491.1 acetyl-CoA carboxylase biotin carboxyl carrier protein subunit [Quisquiliibacterium sp.]HQP68298.1 acetyl-CoA carboxylase biotin carboxyl carrier protein subunit [Quisquiliibacterium sp.]
MASIKINTEVSGSVWKLLKKAGDTVDAGEEIMLIESMKMEIPVSSETGGRIDSINVAEGEAVTEGQTVAVVVS